MEDDAIIKQADDLERDRIAARTQRHRATLRVVTGIFATFCLAGAIAAACAFAVAAHANTEQDRIRAEQEAKAAEKARTQRERERDEAYVEYVNAIGITACDKIRGKR